MHHVALALTLMSIAAAAACGGPQSALDPAGRDAAWMARVFLWVTAAFTVVWLAVVALAAYAPHARADDGRAARALIVGGGVAVPVLTIVVLIVVGFGELPRVLSPGAADAMTVEVSGAQWWWRVRYHARGQVPIELANEIHLPVGRRTNARLVSVDVVHSFWIPPIAGKMDVIPGRMNRLALEPTRLGTFRGACAEYCGTSHARMNLVVVVSDEPTFDAWLANQARPAAAPSDAAARHGHEAFFARGCNTCHTIRGTGAAGVTGPDLTHVGSRKALAAGTLAATPDAFRRWIARTELLKPGVHMPAFIHVPDGELAALAAYLSQLK